MVGTVIPSHVGSDGGINRIAIELPPVDGPVAIPLLARLQATSYLDLWGTPEFGLDDSVWYTQTSIAPSAVSPPPWDSSSWHYDLTAKLFAHGVAGRGQVIANLDQGLENDDCHFRYGPTIADTTQPASLAVQPPTSIGTGDPAYRPANKVVAYYLIDLPGCPSIPWDGVFSHGTSTASAAVGDDYAVLAARAGVVEDNPRDDEDVRLPTQDYGIFIDHHQRADGMAPAAQLIVQDGLDPQTVACSLLPTEDCLQQAYDTGPPGARVHTNQWGKLTTILDASYSAVARDFDAQSWRLRDLSIAVMGGNQGPEPWQLHETSEAKSSITVGATEHADFPSGGPAIDLRAASSHGPGWPDRVKPDLAAPGDDVECVKLVNFTPTPETGIGDGSNGCGDVGLFSGVSFATPTVAGLAALIRQYFVDGYYPAGRPNPSTGFNPTNALVRSVLINATRNLPGAFTADDGTGGAAAPRPTFGQGWGHPVLDDTLAFPGDPSNAADGERSLLLVLNDVPNGHRPVTISDARASIIDSFKPALTEDPTVNPRVHSFSICVDDTEDLHVTLAWSDVPGTVASGTSSGPLRNDLDLEAIDPLGRVWRPNPRTAVWSAGNSVLAPIGQDSTGLGPDRLNPNWSPAGGDSQVDDEQFIDADRSNTVENLFVASTNPDFAPGNWTLNVLGFSVLGNGLPSLLASPNFNNADGDPNMDTIADTEQGYAIIASGKIASSRGILRFSDDVIACDGQVAVTLADCDAPTSTSIEVRTDAGDCDRFSLAGTGPFLTTAPFTVVDPDGSTAPSACDATTPDGDGVVVAPDGSVVVATHSDGNPAGWVASAGIRVRCRDVRLVSAALVEACDDGPFATGDAGPEEWLRLHVVVENTSAAAIHSLWGSVIPVDPLVICPDGGLVFGDVPPGPGATVTGDVLVRVRTGGPCPPTPIQFRMELTGDDGLSDRFYFDTMLDTCTIQTDPSTLPDEVPRDMVLVKVPPGLYDVGFRWTPAAGAARYNVWRGDLSALRHRAYGHAIPSGLGSFCNLTGTTLFLVDGAQLNGENYYFLVNAESTCTGGTDSLPGPFGFANRDRNGSDDSIERRPCGATLEPTCDP